MKEALEYIQNCLNGIERSPLAFGSQEAREHQVVLLLEMRAVLRGQKDYSGSAKLRRFVHENIDESVSAAKLHNRGFPELLFCRLLTQFVHEQLALQDAA